MPLLHCVLYVPIGLLQQEPGCCVLHLWEFPGNFQRSSMNCCKLFLMLQKHEQLLPEKDSDWNRCIDRKCSWPQLMAVA